MIIDMTLPIYFTIITHLVVWALAVAAAVFVLKKAVRGVRVLTAYLRAKRTFSEIFIKLIINRK